MRSVGLTGRAGQRPRPRAADRVAAGSGAPLAPVGGRLPAAAAVGAFVVLLLLVTAVPARAHGRSSDSTNFDSRILQTPAADGVDWRIYGGDEYVAVTASGSQTILVRGYDDEPYLRIGPDGVERNRLSAATYVNADRYANSTVPAFVDPDAPPDWEQVSDTSSWYWHDHRTHWMSPTLPPVVRAAPDRSRVVQDWEIPLEIDGRSAVLTGELWWVPGPSPLPWLLAAVLLTAPALLGLTRARSAAALARPAAAVLGGVALVNVVHLADDLFAAPAPLSATLLAAAQTTLFIAVTAFGAVRGWQAREGAFTALGVGSVAAFVGQGLLYLPALTSSQLQSLVPDAVGRLAIALSLVQLAFVGLVAVVGARRHQVPAAGDSASRVPGATPVGTGEQAT